MRKINVAWQGWVSISASRSQNQRGLAGMGFNLGIKIAKSTWPGRDGFQSRHQDRKINLA
jgi:hypothetical protein